MSKKRNSVAEVFHEAYREAGKSEIVKMHRRISAEADKKAGITRKLCPKCKGRGHLIFKRKKKP